MSNVLHTPTNRVDFNTVDSSGHDCSNDPIFTVRLSLYRSWWRRCRGRFMGPKKNVEIFSITFSDPYRKCLRKPWNFSFFAFFSPCQIACVEIKQNTWTEFLMGTCTYSWSTSHTADKKIIVNSVYVCQIYIVYIRIHELHPKSRGLRTKKFRGW